MKFSNILVHATLGVLALPAYALAQSAPGATATEATERDADSLEEVVVIAQKRSENLQRVPISVIAVTGEQLEASGIATTTQLSQMVTGLSARVTYNQLEPHIRGVGTTAAGPGIENPVALYVDDVYYASQVATAFSLVDVEQVAVLKGPQGTLFGRNATGGVIQVTTRDPQHETQGIVRTSLDNYRTTTSDVYLTGGLTEKLAASFTGRYSSQGKGYGRNITTGADIHKVYSDADARVKLLYTPSDATTIKLSADYSVRSDSLGPNFRQFLPQYTTSALPGFVATSNAWDVSSQTNNHNRFVSDGVSLHLDHQFAWARLTNIAAYRSDHLTTIFDPSASPTPGNDIEINEVTSQITEELRFASLADAPFTWQAGLFLFQGKGRDDPLAVHIRPALTGFPDLRIDIRTNETTKSAAAYVQATKALTPVTNLTVGLRYSWERREFAESQEFFVFGNSTGLLPPTGLPPSQTYKKPTWRIALDQQLTPAVLAYVSYNRGFKSGGYNSHAPDNPPFEPETLDAYEIGAKSQWLDNRLRVNGAVFYYDYSNVQVAKYTTTSLIYNGAKAKIYGVDLDMKAKLAQSWELTAGIEWLHARYSDFPLAPFSTPVLNGGPQLYYASAKGKALNNAPDTTANIALDYAPDVPTGSIDFNLTASFSTKFYQEPDNFLKQPSYTILNAAVTWTAPGGHFSARLFGNNLLDKAVATQLNTLPVPPIGYDVDYAMPPRTGGIGVRYDF